MPPEEDTMREDLAHAFEEVEDNEEETEDSSEDALGDEEEEEEDTSEDTTGELDGEDDEEDYDEEEYDEGEAEEDEASGDEDGGEDEEGEDEEEDDTSPTGKAPDGWRDTAKAVWKDVPPSARFEIHRREQQVKDVLQRTTDERKFAGQMANVIRPFTQHIAREGVGPVAAVQNLLGTAAGLQDPQQAPVVIATLIERYGVDLEALDTAISSGAGRARVEQQTAVERATAPYREAAARASEQQMEAAERMSEDVSISLADFAETHDFYEQVRETMGDIMEMSANRGEEMTLEQAYNQACKMVPEVSEALAARNSVDEVKKKRKAAAKKKRAAKSVRSKSSVERRRKAKSNNPRDDLANDIEAAIASLENG